MLFVSRKNCRSNYFFYVYRYERIMFDYIFVLQKLINQKKYILYEDCKILPDDILVYFDILLCKEDGPRVE